MPIGQPEQIDGLIAAEPKRDCNQPRYAPKVRWGESIVGNTGPWRLLEIGRAKIRELKWPYCQWARRAADLYGIRLLGVTLSSFGSADRSASEQLDLGLVGP